MARSAAAEEPPAATQRILVLVRQDVAWVRGDDPCSATSQTRGDFSCFRNTGTQYLGTPDARRAADVDGFYPATTRFVGGYERFFGEQVALTGLLGVVLRGGGPEPVGSDAHAFLPIHLELDAALWPWGATHRGARLRPFVLAGGGLGEIDAGFPLTVHEDPRAAPAASQLDNPAQQEVEVYAKRGTGFVDFGLGMEGRLSGPLSARGRVLALSSFPRPGTSLGFDFGVAVDL